MNRIIVIPLIALLAVVFTVQVSAQDKSTEMQKKIEKTETKMMDSKSKVEKKMKKADEMVDKKPVNTVCLVSGEEIEADDHVTAEYKGNTYAFCCKRCLKKFNNDPEKYIKKYEETKKAEMKDKMEMKKEN